VPPRFLRRDSSLGRYQFLALVPGTEQRTHDQIDPPGSDGRDADGDEERPEWRGPDGAQLGSRDGARVRVQAIERVVERAGAEAQSSKTFGYDRVGEVDAADRDRACADSTPAQPGDAPLVAEGWKRIGWGGAGGMRRLGDEGGEQMVVGAAVDRGAGADTLVVEVAPARLDLDHG